MKRPVFALLALLVAAAAAVAGEDPRIGRIRALYREAAAMETAEAYHPSHLVELNTIVPAIGSQTTKLAFIFTSTQANPEKDPYAMSYRLHKVKVTYNVAANAGFLVEYLYDGKERPVFCYSKEEREYHTARGVIRAASERRYYFDGGALIMAVVGVMDEDGKAARYTAASSFRQDDIVRSRTALANAGEYLGFFRHMVRVERLK